MLVDALRRRGARYELGVMRRLLQALGSPQERLPVVLIGGTNGKGSVAALLSSITHGTGCRTGLYTSPHLESEEECFRIDGEAIAPDGLGELLSEVVAVAEAELGVEITYFEAFTAAALLWFNRQRVQLAILEVGLGGRLDATNCCEPVLSLVTTIDLDHTAELGPDLTSIALHKAGIFRAGRLAQVAASAQEAQQALAAEAARLGARLLEVKDAASWSCETGPQAPRMTLKTPRACYSLRPRLPGSHQGENLALAVLAAEALAELGRLHLTPDVVERAVGSCHWPGRLEWVRLPDGAEVLLDGAHNPGGARALRRYLRELGGPYDLLFGVFRDKELKGMFPALATGASRVVLTRAPGPRGASPEALRALLEPSLAANIEPEIHRALEVALTGERLLVVCGSLALVGAVRLQLRQAFGVPAPASGNLFRDSKFRNSNRMAAR